MSISNPIIVAPTKTRRSIGMTVGHITSAIPPDSRVYVDKDGLVQAETQLPEREGQMLFYQGDGGQIIMYVVVDFDQQGTLQWAPVVPNTVPIDPRSGKPKDPLYNFYGLHAS
jgi:hypothetical protein